MSNRRWLTLLTLLYVAEGLPFGVIHETVPVWLKAKGMSLETLGLVSLVGLPWTLKALWAPLVDRWFSPGAWIRGALIGVIALTAALPWTEQAAVWWVALTALALVSATQDIAIDGYAATALPPALHGRANGIRIGAYRGAMLFAGGAMVAAAPYIGWETVFGGIALVAAGVAVATGHLPAVPESRVRPTHWFADLAAWLRGQGWVSAAAFVLFILSFKVGDAAMGPMVKPFWLDSGRSLQEVGVVTTIVGTLMTVVGGLIGGEMVSRWGLVRALLVLGAAQGLSNVGYAAAATAPSSAALYTASVVESLCTGLGTAAYLAFLTRACAGAQGATRFALLSSLAGLTRTLAGAVSGFGVARLGYPAFFLYTAALSLPALALIPWIRARAEGVAAVDDAGSAAG